MPYTLKSPDTVLAHDFYSYEPPRREPVADER
jgi:hypothetical protein